MHKIKNHRLTKRRDFLRVKNIGVSAKRYGLVMQMAKRDEPKQDGKDKISAIERKKTTGKDSVGNLRTGYTASKYIGNAVIRNRAKRRMRALVFEYEKATTNKKVNKKTNKKANLSFLPYACDMVLIARQSTPSLPWSNLQRQYNFLLKECIDKLMGNKHKS